MRCRQNYLSAAIGTSLLLLALHVQADTGSDADAAAQEKAGGEAAKPAARTASKDVTDFGTVVVTARGVEESLQEMPLPISAVSAETIEQKGFNDVRDIAATTPSFSFRAAFGRDMDRPVIRGMSNILGEPNASFFIDGIHVEGDISAFGLENVEQVEVIRGPQSAAFGRRTFSGAVNFITKRPGSDPGGKVTVEGGSYGSHRVGLYYSGKLAGGALGYNVSLMDRGNDGVFYNPVAGEKDVGGTSTKAFMGALNWRPNDSLDVTTRLSWQRMRDQPFAINRMGSSQANCFLPIYTGANLAPGIPILASRRRGYYCGTPPTPTDIPLNTPQFRLAGWFPGLKRENIRSSVVARYTMDNFWTLQSTTAYNESEKYQAYDQDWSAARGFGGAFEAITQKTNRDISQDLRVTSDQGKPVYAMVGLYYYRQRTGPAFNGSLAGFALSPTAPLFPVVPVTTHPQDETENIAAYAFVNWDINDQWTASFEGRYAKDAISIAGTDRRSITIAGSPTIVSRAYALNESFVNFTPRLTLAYQWKDNVNFYGLYAKGSKPGGFNVDVQRADIKDSERDRMVARGYHVYDEEKALNYELGMKSNWLDGSLRVNTALYWIDWTNQQLTAGEPVRLLNDTLFSTSYVSNIGKSRIRGFEVESQWNFAEGWNLDVTYSYTDAKIRDFVSQGRADLLSSLPATTINDPIANAAGNMLPMVPKHQGSGGLGYQSQFANGWAWSAFGGVIYESSRWDTNNLIESGSLARANFRFSLQPRENLRVYAYVSNAFNNRTPDGITGYLDPTASVAVPQVPPLTGLQVTNRTDFAISPPLPRMWGVGIDYRF